MTKYRVPRSVLGKNLKGKNLKGSKESQDSEESQQDKHIIKDDDVSDVRKSDVGRVPRTTPVSGQEMPINKGMHPD